MDKVALLAKLEKIFGLGLEDSKVLIVGLGSTGFSVARFLYSLELKSHFAVIDSRNKPPLIEQLTEHMPDVPVFTGGFDKAAFEVATHLIVSPGVSLMEASIQKAIAVGVKILSDIDLFACATEKPVIAITGSNGKSTVTTILGEMGNAAGVKTAIGGNLGVPALDLLQQDAELYVLELSSFQLERTSVLNAKAATVLNVSADHLDRHDGIMGYANEKQHIFMGNGAMVLNADDPIVMAMKEPGRDVQTFSVKTTADFYVDKSRKYLMYHDQILMQAAELPLEGQHNTANALAALALGKAIGLNEKDMCKALKKFKGLEHRMQKVAELNGVCWVNDSKATNIGACVAALQGYQKKVVLIAGGDAKGADMQELVPVIKEKCKGVVLMGKDAELIALALNNCAPVYFADTMKSAVKIAAGLADAGDSVLLSPACASLDQYKNYMERGNKFAAAVMELAA